MRQTSTDVFLTIINSEVGQRADIHTTVIDVGNDVLLWQANGGTMLGLQRCVNVRKRCSMYVELTTMEQRSGITSAPVWELWQL